MVIDTVLLPESSAIAKARLTVPTGMATDIPPTVACPPTELLRKIYVYPIIIQVRRPFDNTASSCPGSLPLGIIYFHVVI